MTQDMIRMEIEVVYALPDRAWRCSVEINPGATAAEVFADSGLAEVTGDAKIQLGVFGRKVADNYVMQRGERLEVYRPLTADPKQRRRRRAQAES